MTVILIVIFIIIAIAMIIAAVRFNNLVNDTKEKAEAMTEEEKMSYSPFNENDEDNSSEDV